MALWMIAFSPCLYHSLHGVANNGLFSNFCVILSLIKLPHFRMQTPPNPVVQRNPKSNLNRPFGPRVERATSHQVRLRFKSRLMSRCQPHFPRLGTIAFKLHSWLHSSHSQVLTVRLTCIGIKPTWHTHSGHALPPPPLC